MLRAGLNRLAGFLIVLLLVLTGQSLALVRGQAAPMGQAVICTGTGPVIVYLDENGQPTGPPRYCPDFAMHGFDMVAAIVSVSPDIRRLARVPETFVGAILAGQAGPAAVARGPPRLV